MFRPGVPKWTSHLHFSSFQWNIWHDCQSVWPLILTLFELIAEVMYLLRLYQLISRCLRLLICDSQTQSFNLQQGQTLFFVLLRTSAIELCIEESIQLFHFRALRSKWKKTFCSLTVTKTFQPLSKNDSSER